MGFTVTHQGDTKDIPFEEYFQLLRKRGLDLAQAPRTPEPGAGRRWLPVWDGREEAEAFAKQLQKQTRDQAWEVVEVNGRPSKGPLGPVEIKVSLRSDAWAFQLHPFSRMIVREVFPGSCRMPTVSIGLEWPQESRTTHQEFADLTQQVAVILTGLSLAQITEAFGGYRVYEHPTKKELVPSAPVQA